jgi:hypothetical protein
MESEDNVAPLIDLSCKAISKLVYHGISETEIDLLPDHLQIKILKLR